MSGVLIMLTLLPAIVLQPLSCEGPFIQTVLKPFDNEGLSSKNDVQQDQFVEGFQALGLDHIT